MRNEPAEIYSTARRRRPSRVNRFPIALALVGLAFAGLLLAVGRGDDKSHASVTLVAGDSRLAISSVDRLRGLSQIQLADWLEHLPVTRTERRGPGIFTFQSSPASALASVRRAIQTGGAEVRIPERALSARVQLPIVKQAYRNNCETAALSMLLASAKTRVNQVTLQRKLPRDGPLDPQGGAQGGLPVWGDPRKGFVGRVSGGGVAGGYGVYEPPIQKVASRYDVNLTSMSRASPKALYRRLLEGHPVMVWVGLSDGPYMNWKTPADARITGNFGEHTVVLTGIGLDGLDVNDPLTGMRKHWPRAYFELLWSRLGRRALTI